MTNYRLPLATAVAAAVLSASAALAQTTQPDAAPSSSVPAGQTAKPSPYQGVSTPPASDVITTTDVGSAHPSAQPAPAAAPASDPDAGIVETPLPPPSPDAAPAASTVKTPQLQTRPDETSGYDQTSGYDAAGVDSSLDMPRNNPDARIVTYVSGPANALPEGTAFRVRLLQGINAEATAAGTTFRAQLTQDLVHNGNIVVPRGSELRGRVVYTSWGRRIGGRSVIHLRAEEFLLPDGAHYQLNARVIDTQGSDTKATDEGNIVPENHGKRTLVEVAAVSGGGAVVGAELGGGVGAAVGSAVGAGVVTAHWLLAEHAAELPAESTVVFSLTDPMLLTPSKN